MFSFFFPSKFSRWKNSVNVFLFRGSVCEAGKDYNEDVNDSGLVSV